MGTPSMLLEKVKQDAISQARRGATTSWLSFAELAVLRAMQRKPEGFTTDDVWAELEKDGSSGRTAEPRALGAVMRDMAVRGVIQATSQYEHSTRRVCHSRPVRVWKRR